MEKLNVLVLGDGLLGSELVKQTGWDFISRKNETFDMDNIWGSIPKDDKFTPKHNIIINCIANTDTYSKVKDLHWEVNYQFVDKLIKYCNANNVKLVHISTDYLYSGSNPNASEEDVPVHCNNWYGYTKLLGDGLVQLQANDYLLIRCTHKIKPFPYENAWVNQTGNFDYVDVISGLIIKLVKSDSFGLFNVGTETKSMYDLALETKSVGLDLAPFYVPKNTSMNITKLKNKLDA